jgi:hypothetical protein
VTEKASPALADSSAAGVIRALLDFRSVWTTHDLVALSRVPAPTIHRVVGCLEREELVTRTAGAVFAAHHWAPTTPTTTMTIYTADPHAAAEAWNLIPASSGDVVLAAPSSDIVYTRPRKTPTGLRLTAPAQVLTDLLTGAAPSPATADHLLTWMQTHELQWRY